MGGGSEPVRAQDVHSVLFFLIFMTCQKPQKMFSRLWPKLPKTNPKKFRDCARIGVWHCPGRDNPPDHASREGGVRGGAFRTGVVEPAGSAGEDAEAAGLVCKALVGGFARFEVCVRQADVFAGGAQRIVR